MAEYTSRYNPNRGSDWNYKGAKWRLSRSKIDLFFECPRCFYVDNKLGTKRPNFPPFNLNLAVDELFKKEFDVHRAAKTKHPIMEQYNIDAIPYTHKDLDIWRDNFAGVEYTDTETGLVVSGALDDVWETPNGSLIVIDYKATSKPGKIESLGDSSWEKQYTRQLGVYRWILEQNGFTVEPTGYLVYANARTDVPGFDSQLAFDITLVPVQTDTDWIETTLDAIKECLEGETIPVSGASCEYCPYREAAGKKLLALHQQQKMNAANPTEATDPSATIANLKKRYG